MGTGVSPGRIATGKFCYQVFSFFFVHAPIDLLSAMLLIASRPVARHMASFVLTQSRMQASSPVLCQNLPHGLLDNWTAIQPLLLP